MRICVVALGKIGLPLAVQFAAKGHQVTGVDTDPRVVAAVGVGADPHGGQEHDLEARLSHAVTAGLLHARTDTTAAVAESDVVVVVVPVVVGADGAPDFTAIDAATAAVGAGLRPGTLVSYETTLPVHTTRRRFVPALAAASGLTPGSDLLVCHSPERVLTGRVFADLRRYPKLVGGVDEYSTKRAVDFYESVLDFDERTDLPRPNGVWDLGDAETAEFAKLAETTYRDVNIGLANQFARFADGAGIDVGRVIEAANSQPYSHIHRPGVAVGGHCIPVYPRFYAHNDPDATIVRAARTTNSGMPGYTVGLLDGLLAATGHPGLREARVAVLGVSYRGGVRETAYSGVFPLTEALRAAGATPYAHDPLYRDEEITALGLTPYHIGEPVDAVLVHTDHDQYRRVGAEQFPGVRALVDGRGVTDPARWVSVPRRTVGGGGR